MTRYLVTDSEIKHAIHEAIKAQDKDPEGDNYVIEISMDVVKDVLKRLDKSIVDESEQTENPKQDAGRGIDTSEHPFIQLEADELVRIICDAYQTGVSSGKKQS